MQARRPQADQWVLAVEKDQIGTNPRHVGALHQQRLARAEDKQHSVADPRCLRRRHIGQAKSGQGNAVDPVFKGDDGIRLAA